MKKSKFHPWLALASLVLAFVIWIAVVNVSDPATSITYTGITVEILNADLITDNNQTYEILDDSNLITVTITAKRSINDLLSRENIKATADFSDYDEETGEIKIKLETTKYNEKIDSIKAKTETVSVALEDILRKQLSIQTVVAGEPAEGYVTGDVSLSQNVVTVQGPESVVSLIDHATAEVSVAGMSSSISTSSIIRYYDENGDIIDSSKLTTNIATVDMTVELLATKTVDVIVSYSGDVAEGYGVSDVSVDVTSVTIAGRASTIANVTEITIPASEVDVTDATETFTEGISLKKYLPDNISFPEDDFNGIVKITVTIEALEVKEIEVPTEDIAITGYDSDAQTVTFALTTEDAVVYEVTGLAADLAALDTTALSYTIDVAAYTKQKGVDTLSTGTYDMPVTVALPDGVSIAGTFTVKCRVKNN